MTRHAVLLAGPAIICARTPAAAQSVDPARDAAFARVEYWQCPERNRAAFEDVIHTMWKPVFDEMVKEGLFTAWSAMAPVDAREVGFEGGEARAQPSAPTWSWVVSWQAVTRTALEDAWPEYHRRLAAMFPGRSGPDTFCTRVRIVNHRVLR